MRNLHFAESGTAVIRKSVHVQVVENMGIKKIFEKNGNRS